MLASHQGCSKDNAIFGELSCIRGCGFKPSERAGVATRANRTNNSACVAASRAGNPACISAGRN
jgi:hypothetical protein